MNILKRFIPLLCAAFLLACCAVGFSVPASALTAPDTPPPPDGWYAVLVTYKGTEVYYVYAEAPLVSVTWSAADIQFVFEDKTSAYQTDSLSPIESVVTSGSSYYAYGSIPFGDPVWNAGAKANVYTFELVPFSDTTPPTTEPPATTPEDDTPASPSAGVFPQLYDVLSEFIYGVNSDVLTASQDLTLTLLATIGAIFVVAIPFFIVWKAINMLG